VMQKKAVVQDFLLEIGCEELPADYMPLALDWNQMVQGLGRSTYLVFDENHIVWKKLETFGTPRRLVLKVSGVQSEVREEIEGPPVSVGFNSQGQPTEAAQGFAKKQGVSVSELKKKETARGSRLVVERVIPVTDVLASAVPQIIQKVSFPKTMRWDDSGVRFARPIRWLLTLYGPQEIQCAFGKTTSNRVTFGSRRTGYKPIRIQKAEDYLSAIRKQGVQLEEGQPFEQEDEWPIPLYLNTHKKETLLKCLRDETKRLGGRLPDEDTEEFKGLLNTVTFLAEDPIVEAGSFRPEYLDLPPEVLATSMAKHLKLFSVRESNSWKLLPKFLAVLEGKPKKPAKVMANIERILEARFTDARFFYREDTKTPLEAKVPELAKVVFHEKLGAVGEKIHRLHRLMKFIGQQIAGVKKSEWDELSRDIVTLCKADLVTQMVREFPSLQGTMGRYYAERDGQPKAVVQAIAQQYWPRTAKDPIPSAPLAAAIALADRVDTLIGYFGVGMKPTGSMDPYSLRRQALGVVRILTEFDLPTDDPEHLFFLGLSIDRLFDEGIQSWGSRLKTNPAILKKELMAFLRERFEWLLRQNSEYQPLIEAVLAAGEEDLADAKERFEELLLLWREDKTKPNSSLIKAAKVAERTGRIVKSVKGDNGLDSVNSDIFKEQSERKLWDVWKRAEPILKEHLDNRRYHEAIATYAQLYPEIHEFFEKVFVMDENMDLRRNRLALMNEIFQSLSGSFADLSKLPLAGLEPS